MDPSKGKRQYLVTYSKADETKIPGGRQEFGELVAKAFNSGKSKVKVSHWACSRELHADGSPHFSFVMFSNIMNKLLHKLL